MKTIQDFIDFFEAIPEDKWTTDFYTFENKCCALGHLGMRTGVNTEASSILFRLITKSYIIAANDDVYQLIYKGNNPKERVLNLLKSKRGVDL